MQKTCIGVGMLLAALIAGWIAANANVSPTKAFRRYVYSPIPQSVQNIVFEGKDTLGLAQECRCFLTFTISPTDAARIVNEKGFRPRPSTWGQSGPKWFNPPTNGLSFSRYIPTSLRRFPRWGQTEFFWIDETGTNGFFMVWRSD